MHSCVCVSVHATVRVRVLERMFVRQPVPRCATVRVRFPVIRSACGGDGVRARVCSTCKLVCSFTGKFESRRDSVSARCNLKGRRSTWPDNRRARDSDDCGLFTEPGGRRAVTIAGRRPERPARRRAARRARSESRMRSAAARAARGPTAAVDLPPAAPGPGQAVTPALLTGRPARALQKTALHCAAYSESVYGPRREPERWAARCSNCD